MLATPPSSPSLHCDYVACLCPLYHSPCSIGKLGGWTCGQLPRGSRIAFTASVDTQSTAGSPSVSRPRASLAGPRSQVLPTPGQVSQRTRQKLWSACDATLAPPVPLLFAGLRKRIRLAPSSSVLLGIAEGEARGKAGRGWGTRRAWKAPDANRQDRLLNDGQQSAGVRRWAKRATAGRPLDYSESPALRTVESLYLAPVSVMAWVGDAEHFDS